MKRPVLVKRDKVIRGSQGIAFVVGIAIALVLGALLLWVSGSDPFEVYDRMWTSSLGSTAGLENTLNRAVPLALAGLAVAVAGTMGLWNIGAEGQIMAGAMGAAWVARIGDGWDGPVLITAMIAGGVIGGLLWALGPALARAHLGVNEIITTLMLNEVAIRLATYLIQGRWKDPDSLGFPVATPAPRPGPAAVDPRRRAPRCRARPPGRGVRRLSDHPHHVGATNCGWPVPRRPRRSTPASRCGARSSLCW